MRFLIAVEVERSDGPIGTPREEVENSLVEAVEGASLEFEAGNGGYATFEIVSVDISEPPRIRKARRAKAKPESITAKEIREALEPLNETPK